MKFPFMGQENHIIFDSHFSNQLDCSLYAFQHYTLPFTTACLLLFVYSRSLSFVGTKASVPDKVEEKEASSGLVSHYLSVWRNSKIQS